MSTDPSADPSTGNPENPSGWPRKRFPRTRLQFVFCLYVVFAAIILTSLAFIHHLRGVAYEEAAEKLTAKHDVTFVPGVWNDNRMQEWIIDDVKHECRLTDAALLCLDGSVYER